MTNIVKCSKDFFWYPMTPYTYCVFSCCINPIFFMISHLYMYVTVINMLSFIISLFLYLIFFFNVFSYFLVIVIAF